MFTFTQKYTKVTPPTKENKTNAVLKLGLV